MSDFIGYPADLPGLDLLETEYVAVTSDEGSHYVASFLERIRRQLGVDVVYVSQFIGGMRVVREVAGVCPEFCV